MNATPVPDAQGAKPKSDQIMEAWMAVTDRILSYTPDLFNSHRTGLECVLSWIDERAHDASPKDGWQPVSTDLLHRVRNNLIRYGTNKATMALVAELNVVIAAAPQDDGYKEAWYEIAYLLGIGAQNASPKDVHANQMMPRLRALRELEAATPQDSVPAWAWRQEINAAMVADGWSERSRMDTIELIESRALALAQTKG